MIDAVRTPEDILIEREELVLLDRALEDIPARTERAVRMYYGIGHGEPHTLAEVGEGFGVTRTRISQIVQKAQRQLRHRLRKHFPERIHERVVPRSAPPPAEPKRVWGPPIIVEAFDVTPYREAAFDLDPANVAAYAAALTHMLTIQRGLR